LHNLKFKRCENVRAMLTHPSASKAHGCLRCSLEFQLQDAGEPKPAKNTTNGEEPH